MKEYSISVIPGDGIGPELTEATLKILEATEKKFGLKFNLVYAEAGDACKEKRGVALPEDSVKKIKNSHACLKGPVGETAADVIVKLRLMFDLYANLRPIKTYPAASSSQTRHRHVFCPGKHRRRLQRLRVHYRQKHNTLPESNHKESM